MIRSPSSTRSRQAGSPATALRRPAHRRHVVRHRRYVQRCGGSTRSAQRSRRFAARRVALRVRASRSWTTVAERADAPSSTGGSRVLRPRCRVSGMAVELAIVQRRCADAAPPPIVPSVVRAEPACAKRPRRTIPAMRLNAYLARAGVASRRGADELIKAGRVHRQRRAGRAEHVRRRAATGSSSTAAARAAAARLRAAAQARRASSRPPATRRAGRTVVDLVGHETRVVPVGRLDADTTGALLLTNDGELAHRLAHPRYEVEKVYVAEVEGEPERRGARAGSQQGVELDDGPTAPGARAAPRPSPRRADAPRGPQAPGEADARGRRPPGRRLHRSRYAGLTLEGLEPGQWRELEPSEVERLRTRRPGRAPARAGRSPGRSNP